MAVFTRSTPVAATPAALFRFHENPRNLRAIAPRGLCILDIEAGEIARLGATFRLAVRQGPLTLHWTGRWETVAPPGLLVDVGVRCPFDFWRHHHIFEPHDEGSLLTDRVEFRLPWHLGGPVGDWIALRFVFPRIFAARHDATRAYFSRARP